jgi:nucleotide-binding universal stress UspA family protein
MFQTILHPTDFSEPAGAAFRLACSLAREHGARLVVAHVLAPVISIPELEGMLLAPEEYRDDLAARLRQVKPEDPAVCVEHRLLEGDPARETVRLALELKCDLIVLGTHGRTGLARLVLGSVAEHVLRLAPCPVLTVRVHPGTGAAREAPTRQGQVFKA